MLVMHPIFDRKVEKNKQKNPNIFIKKFGQDCSVSEWGAGRIGS